MNLEKAIEILQAIRHTGHYQPTRDDVDAVELGIEALKRLVAWRNDNDEDLLWDLPGETTD